MIKIKLLSIFILFIGCSIKSKRYNVEGVGKITLSPKGEYSYDFRNTGTWYKKGKVYVLNSYHNPYKIDDVKMLFSIDSLSQQTTFIAKHGGSGIIPDKVLYHFFSLSSDTLIEIKKSDEPLKMDKKVLSRYDSFQISIPWRMELLRYSVSIPFNSSFNNDSLTMVINEPNPDFYIFLDNKAFYRKGDSLISVSADLESVQ